MHITQIHFRAFDRDNVEMFITTEPIMEHGVRSRIRTICPTALPQKVIRYEAVELKTIHEDLYDTHGKRITPDLI